MKLPSDSELWAVSIVPSKESALFKKRNESKGHSVTFPLLWDKDHKIIEKFGLTDPRYKGGKYDGIPYASMYIIDKDGKVFFTHVALTYSKRPSTAQIAEILIGALK